MPPALEVIDAHIHLWDPRSTPREVSPAVKLLGWNERLLTSVGPRLFPRSSVDFVGVTDHVLGAYLPGSWRRDSEAARPRGFVHVQAGWKAPDPFGPVGETRWLEEVCGQELLGIVARADLGSPELGAVLDAHAAASRRFVGIRDMLALDPDPGVMDFAARPALLEEPAWRQGFAVLGERGLTFDAWMYQPQLRAFERVVAEHPTTRVVLDHLGTPIGLGGPYASHGESAADRDRLAATWADDLARLAEHPQVHAKISGLTMPILGWGYHRRPHPPSLNEVVDDLGSLVEVALRCFGPERCIVASNFPMDKASLPWATLHDALVQLTAPLGAEAQRALFHDNAARFYELKGIANQRRG